MNFFQHQDQARKSTRLLVVLFLLAVVALIAVTTLFVAGLLHYAEAGARPPSQSGSHWLAQVDPQLLGGIAAVVLALVALGSLYRWFELRSGGDNIALGLGGRRLAPDSRDPDERRLLNVVEEMAIASGTPVPPVYLLEEPGINAFAAGNDLHDAVIGVTRGCLTALDRDQLQGVVAHEFSHILHGDMRHNLRLLGLLHGILIIGLLGSLLLRSASRPRLSSRRGNGAGGIALLGLGLVVIGYTGTLFGRLIKAAVSRQREFLADASAVQFTRNPKGISGALQAIGGHAGGALLAHPRAEEFSHMYFGEGVAAGLAGWLATHPPLEQRIRRLTPGWNGRYPVAAAATSAYAGGSTATPLANDRVTALSDGKHTALTRTDTVPAPELQVANPDAAHLAYAHDLLQQLPAELLQAARDPFSARALVYNLLIHEDETREQQWQQLQRRAHPAVFKLTRKLRQPLAQLDKRARLPLFELTLPALRSLSAPQMQVFRQNLVALIKADEQVAVFEWALYRMLLNSLQPATPSAPPSRSSLAHLGVPIQQLLSTLAHEGQPDPAAADAAYCAAMASLGLANLPLRPRAQLSLALLDSALGQLRDLRPLRKPALLKAMQTCILHDGHVQAAEYELLRAVADSLNCPLPPLLQK